MSRTSHYSAGFMGSVLAALLAGCVAGPTALKVSRVRYNEAIQSTRKEQLLLNLVRLQYREEPLFLDVGSVAAQFQFGESANVAGVINEGPNPVNPDSLSLSAGVGYEERPTITLTPLRGKDFANRLLAPVQLDLIVLLERTGWSIDRVLRLTVSNMNGLDNAGSASGPTPDDLPYYEAFARVSKRLRELQSQGMLRLGYEARSRDLFGPVPVEQTSLLDAAEAVNKGYGLRTTEDGKNVVLTGESKVLVWRIPPEAAGLPAVQEIVELLGLEPGQSCYEVRPGLTSRADRSTAAGRCTEILVTPRSLMGILFYLSQGIDVPRRHRDKGLVTTTAYPDGQPFDWSLVTGDLLQIHSQRTMPTGAAVAAHYHGHWYYIDDSDLTSKSTFALLGQLFALQAGGAETVAPVLTLPVGG